MRLGVLQTGKVNEALAGTFDEYPQMFEDMYRAVDPSVTVTGYAVVDTDFPEDPRAHDAWIITGSKHGVYDDLPWIAPLKDFLREIRAARVPMVGICFGHQIMAEAFGGRAEKSDKGWGVGAHDYSITQRPEWMSEAPNDFTMHAFHQDQVTDLPEDARVLATSDFCENAMISYGDPNVPDAVSIQPHPEFDARYVQAILDRLSGNTVPTDRAEAASRSLGRAVDGLAFARWSLDYVRKVLDREQAA